MKTMKRRRGGFFRGHRLSALATVAALWMMACDGSSLGPDLPDGAEVGVVLNSIDRTLTVFEVERPDNVFTIGLGPDGSPVGFALRDGIVVVPMGSLPALVVVDLNEREIRRVIELTPNSGATGVAFLDDDTVLVGNPNLDSVSPVNISTGVVGAEILVGMFPEFVVSDDSRAYVINAELDDNFTPLRSGTVTVVDGMTLSVIETVELSGENPGGASISPDGRLFVANRGRFGERSGSLSVISTGTFQEIAFDAGFDEFPFGVEFGPDGNVYVTSTEYGVAIWDPENGTFVRDPFNPLAPGGNRSSAGVAFDSGGRLYALELECVSDGDVFRLDAELNLERTIRVGTCPFDIAFTTLDS